MATNYGMPVAPPYAPPPGPPSGPPQQMQPSGPPPTPPPPTPPPMTAQQTFPVGSNIPAMPLRASQNITYGSLYPSRPGGGGTVGGYMSYNVSMGGQPMYQHGQPVPMSQATSQGQIAGQSIYPQGRQVPPTTATSAGGQMLSGNLNEQQRQRQLSGPSGYNPAYMPPKSASPFSAPPSPGHDLNGQRVRHVSGPSATCPAPDFNTAAPPPAMLSQQQQVAMNGQMQVAQSGNQPPMQMTGSGNQPVFTYQQEGQMVSRMSTNYLSSSGPYGTGMKNLSMSASAPLGQQLGFRRDSSFPLTDMEKSKINR